MNVREHTKEANIKRVIVGRIPRGEDLLTGIREICEEYGIKNGYITGLLGSLDTGRFIYAIPNEEGKIGFVYSDSVDVEGPLELLAGQGIIGTEDNGNLSIHLHMLVSDKYMRVFGGHFVDGVNRVAATAEIVIHEIENAEYKREFDNQTGFKLFKIK
nr:PPC domain-containing DNA-binding protein [Sedimentibacter sp.]